MTEKERRTMYRALAAQQVWRPVLSDILAHASSLDSADKSGALQLFAYIWDSAHGDAPEEE